MAAAELGHISFLPTATCTANTGADVSAITWHAVGGGTDSSHVVTTGASVGIAGVVHTSTATGTVLSGHYVGHQVNIGVQDHLRPVLRLPTHRHRSRLPHQTAWVRSPPRRWIVERTWAWLVNHRRLRTDYERDPIVTAGLVWAAHARLLLRRLTTP